MGVLTSISEQDRARRRERAGINRELAAWLSDDVRNARERMEAAADLRKHAGKLRQLTTADESPVAADLEIIATDLGRIASDVDKRPTEPVKPS